MARSFSSSPEGCAQRGAQKPRHHQHVRLVITFFFPDDLSRCFKLPPNDLLQGESIAWYAALMEEDQDWHRLAFRYVAPPRFWPGGGTTLVAQLRPPLQAGGRCSPGDMLPWRGSGDLSPVSW